MLEIIKIIIGVGILALGVPIGDFLARQTKEELKDGRVWFKLIIILCALGAVMGLIFKQDVLLFSLLFIAIVTSRSLVNLTKKAKR